MNFRYLCLLLTVWILNTKCGVMKSSSQKLFDMQDTYYQSWVISENEKGTDIVIELFNVQQGIKFDSIVFRGIQLPVFVVEKQGVFTLKSILNAGMSKISIEKKIAGKPDQLIYTYQGTKYSFALKNIRRLKTKYF